MVDTKYGRSFYVHSIGEITGIYTEKMTFSKPLECEEYVGAGTAEKKAISISGSALFIPPRAVLTANMSTMRTKLP